MLLSRLTSFAEIQQPESPRLQFSYLHIYFKHLFHRGHSAKTKCLEKLPARWVVGGGSGDKQSREARPHSAPGSQPVALEQSPASGPRMDTEQHLRLREQRVHSRGCREPCRPAGSETAGTAGREPREARQETDVGSVWTLFPREGGVTGTV